MATSGSINLTASRDDIITEALELLGVLPEGESPNANQLTASARTLNYMIKSWQADGLNLFAVQKVYLFTNKDQSTYTLNSSTTDHYTASFTQTALSADALSGATSITVDSISGISASDKIGVYQDDDTVHWTTVSGAPSGATITLASALTAAASDDAVVYAYTSKANRPMRVMEAVVHHAASGTDIPVLVGSRTEYFDQTLKTTDSRVNTIWYDPQVAAPKLSVWPQSDDERDYLILNIQRTLEDLDAASDDVDFPQEWFMALSYNLAMNLGPKHGKQNLSQLAAIAEREYSRVRASDDESASVFLLPAHG